MLGADLPALESETALQRELCSQLAGAGTGMDSPEFQNVVEHLQWQIRLYGAVLRRSRRTLGIFCRAFASAAGTYSAPGGGVNSVRS